MNKKVIQKWIKALRSDKYQQCSVVLSSGDNQFCVLGVLANLYAQEFGHEWEAALWGPYAGVPFNRPCRAILGETHALINPIREWAGLTYAQCSRLSSSNDRGRTYKQLAYHIQRMAGM